MTKQKLQTEFVAGRGYTQSDWDEVCDTPELTQTDISQMRPFTDVFPKQAQAIRKGRGQQKQPVKQQVTLRIDRSIVEAFKAKGAGWQSRINDTLKTALKSGQ